METNRTVLQMKYGRIVKAFAEKANISLEELLTKFMNRKFSCLWKKGNIADMHCMSDIYLTDGTSYRIWL